MRLSVIIPLYNEAPYIGHTLERLQAVAMPAFVDTAEIIVVDDCSTDGSDVIVEKSAHGRYKVSLIRMSSNRGKGAAVREGIRISEGDTIIIQDADLELDPADIPLLLGKMHDENLDLVSGTRFRIRKEFPEEARPFIRANILFSMLASGIKSRKISDVTCGYKCFRKSLTEKIRLTESGFGIETELMMKSLSVSGIRYGECDVSYYPRRKSEGKKIRIIDGLKILGKTLYYGFAGRNSLSWATIALILIVMTWHMLSVQHWKEEKRVIEWDGISYYSYLPAALIYNDISLSFIDGYSGDHKFIFWPDKTREGNYVIITTMGLSILWFPFFIAGHLVALVTGADTGGFSPPYKFFLLVSALFYLATGLVYLRKIILKHFPDIIAALTLAGFAFATNLYWYTLFQSTMSHVYSFALITSFVWYSMKWHDNVSSSITAWSGVRLGLLLGLISLVRPTNVIIVIFFLLYGIKTVKDLTGRIKIFLKDYKSLLAMVLAVFAVWIPQMLYWKEITGNWIYYSYGGDERFFFNDPAILKGLFSYRKGLFIYTPLMIFAFAGIATLWRQKSPHAAAISVFVPLNIYIIFSWWCWWYGGGFGQRAFIDSYALMAVAAAALLHYAYSNIRKWIKGSIVTAYALLFLLGVFNNIQYYHGAIHWDSMTREAYWDSFGRITPSSHFQTLLEAPDYDKARKGEER